MWTYITKGGPVMIPILVGSIIGFAITIERLFVFRQTMKIRTFEFVAQIFRLLKEGNREEALNACGHYRYFPLAVLFKIGIERASLPAARLEKILEQAGNNQIQKLEKHLSVLVAIIGIEPLLGFLGTITGLIKAFSTWERAGADVTVSALASGIYEAMITTAAGLIIAIPLYMCYTYFVSRSKYIANDLNDHCIQLLEIFSETKEK